MRYAVRSICRGLRFAGLFALCAAGTASCGLFEDRVLAVVNGEAVRESQVEAGMPSHLPERTVRGLRELKLDRLIELVARRQFLEREGIVVPDAEVEEVVGTIKKSPPLASCGCCPYRSFDRYLESQAMTEGEFRLKIRVVLGTERHLGEAWKSAFGDPEKVRDHVAKRRDEFEKDYAVLAEIRFKDSGHEEGREGPDAMGRAEAAWGRLEKGEDFADLAGDISEGEVTGPKGGRIGPQNLGLLPAELRKTLKGMKPGEFTKPLRTQGGAFLLLLRTMTEADLEEILRDEFERRTYLALRKRIASEAKIERKSGTPR
jgi:hypothetical protein